MCEASGKVILSIASVYAIGGQIVAPFIFKGSRFLLPLFSDPIRAPRTDFVRVTNKLPKKSATKKATHRFDSATGKHAVFVYCLCLQTDKSGQPLWAGYKVSSAAIWWSASVGL